MAIALIEIDETDVEGLKIPFTLVYIFENKNASKARTLLMKIHAASKEMGGYYRALDELKKEELGPEPKIDIG